MRPMMRRGGISVFDRQRAEELAQAGPDISAREADLDRGGEEAERAAGVVAAALELVGEHGLGLEEQREAVGELELAALARRRALEHREDLRREDVAADDAEP